MNKENYVLGIDFGTDSVRAVLVDAANGDELSSDVFYYPRWQQGLYCDPTVNQFRQHPLDYSEGLEQTVVNALSKVSPKVAQQVRGIAIDTTGSTPIAVNQQGTPLALTPGFDKNPNAMFILWKDHTAVAEADLINQVAKNWGGTDFTKYVGGIYSSEWFWAKILRTIKVDNKVKEAVYSWVEHCDWIPFLLTGGDDISKMKRSRCAAGHKAMWHPEFSGLPSEEFLEKLDPVLNGIRNRLYNDTYTSDQPAGSLSPEWAKRLGLSEDVIVGVGAFDAHMGAVGGEIIPYHLSKVMGTSTCDMLIAPNTEMGNKLVSGICGQVDGSIVPGMLGMEAGQSAFGDIYAWFSKLLAWPLREILAKSEKIDAATKQELIEESVDQMIPLLSTEAEKIPVDETGLVALDWLNGRRTPDANQSLKGAISGLNLGSDAPRIFKALVEATCFGAKKIVERFEEEGVKIEGIIGLGGVAKKSPFIMQTMADALNRPIKIAKSEQTCALGAAMFAATAAGLYATVGEAKENMGVGFDVTYDPRQEYIPKYQKLYDRFTALGAFVEDQNQTNLPQ